MIMSATNPQCNPNRPTPSSHAAETGERVDPEPASHPTYRSVIPETIPKDRRRGAIGVNDETRFVTLTGHHLAGTLTTIELRTPLRPLVDSLMCETWDTRDMGVTHA